ncbi:MAG: DUF58 domain-containing protein [Actinobacteria bacterium]|nr:DUF58 domain-containing protein [Actinomycetota bacterium]MBO0834065.1 DUF58 domain-containing protein [Actinomycetota bacterium]
MAITGRAALLALAGTLAALTLGTTIGLLVVDGCIVAAILADMIMAASVRSLQISRSGDTRVMLGQRGATTLAIVNPGRRVLRGVLRDSWQPSAGGTERANLRIAAGGGRAVVTTTLEPTRRGDKNAGPITVRSVGPLGLAARQASRDVPWTVRVLPPFLSRKHLPEKLAMLRQLDGQHRSLIRGQGSEFDSLREYVIGDDVRSIDWRSSARRSDILVRTWRPERDRRILLVLDTGRTSAGRVAGLPRLDAAMDAALLLAALAVRAGDRVDLLAADRQVRARVVGASKGEVLPLITDAMAQLEPELIETDWVLLATTVLAVARRRCLLVLLTDLHPSALETGLMPVLPQLASRHQILVAATADPRLTELTADRADAAAVYAAAAAERAVAERARAASVLASHGVDVIDAPPDRLPPELADAYLKLKRGGRL